MAHVPAAYSLRALRAYALPGLVLFIWFVTVLFFGYVGFKKRNPESTTSDRVFFSLQLFALHGDHLPPHMSMNTDESLEIARFLAPAGELVVLVLGLAGILMAFLEIFSDEWRLNALWFPWNRGHIVICGLGDVGLRLALQGRERQPRKYIVAIEKSCPPAVSQLMRDQRVIVLDGDAVDEEQLKTARVKSAEFVVATCPDDETNVAIAAAVGNILASPEEQRGRPLVCRTLIGNPITRQLLSSQNLFPGVSSRYHVNFSDLDRYAVAARQALRLHPLDFAPIREQDDTVVRLVVIGFGITGESLALHAAQIGHFANEVGQPKRRLCLTIVDSTGTTVTEVEARYTNLRRAIDVDLSDSTARSDFLPWLVDMSLPVGSSNALVTYAFCWEDDRADERNFRFGVELAQRLKGRAAQVLIHQNTRKGFAALLSEERRVAALAGRTHAFGMVEDVFDWDVLLHESEDALARALHEDYLGRHPGHAGWDELCEEFRDSNRQAADHIPIKLRALGYHEEPLRKDKVRIARFEEKYEVPLLSKMEHARWCAERYLAGWSHGDKTDPINKINRCLIEWEDLDPEEQKKDPEQINAIPDALYKIGYGIYR
jgi:voltage-gated potassium channel Kch